MNFLRILFNEQGFLNPPNKPQLANEIVNICQHTPSFPADFNVFDGGSNLHRIEWKRGETYGSIAMKYVTYIKNFPTLSSFLMGIQYQLNIALKKCN